MSVTRGWELQQAVYARLATALAGQAPGGGDVPVYDHAPSDPPRLYVRIDGFNAVQGREKNCDRTRTAFFVHVFDRPTTEAAAARGQKTVKLLQALIFSALHDWQPLAGAGVVGHEESNLAPDEDGLTQHGLSRFSCNLGAS